MYKVTVIAEGGINHDGDIAVARKMIRQAKQCGADIFKTQVYDVDKLFPDRQVVINGKNWYEQVKRTQLSYEQVKEMASFCEDVGIEFMASAFDLERLGWLEEVGVKRHKIASCFNENIDYIKAVRNTKKEVIVSSNKSLSWNEFIPRVKRLYCVSEYPTPLSHLRLLEIPFGHIYHGFSDHSIGIGAACVAIARGAVIIEKHFSLNPSSRMNPDHICSASPRELRMLIKFARKVEEMA